MFSGKKIAAVSGLVGGLAVACAGLASASAVAGPGACTDDLMGNLTCTQRIRGEVPEGGSLPHQETCKPVQPVQLPAVLGQGTERLGPEVTCSPTTVGVAPVEKGDEQEPGTGPFGVMSRILPVGVQ
ncbi:hypothetical protein [Streptomyces humi]|uniref:hypothetical protein n=1 Tax=Streptomyces humi TaxID=1428620 RepID=UPI0006287B9E|nr:hypothetical protein [Streptomyces humi]